MAETGPGLFASNRGDSARIALERSALPAWPLFALTGGILVAADMMTVKALRVGMGGQGSAQKRSKQILAAGPGRIVSIGFAYGFRGAPGIALHASLAQGEVGVRYLVRGFLFEYPLFA